MTRYEQFLQSYKDSPIEFKEKCKASGTFEFGEMVRLLQCLQNQLNARTFMFWFGGSEEGDRLYEHLVEKFVEANRNLLQFFNVVDPNIRFFMLHELKNGEETVIRT